MRKPRLRTGRNVRIQDIHGEYHVIDRDREYNPGDERVWRLLLILLAMLLGIGLAWAF